MTWASTALLCSPWCWDVSSLSHSLTILQMQVSHFQIRVCIICTLTLLDFIGCSKVAFPFLSYKMLYRLPKFCWMNTSSRKCNITVNFPCYLKPIIFQDRPLTVTRLRIHYEFCDGFQTELSDQGLVQQFLHKRPVWEPCGTMGGPAFLMFELSALLPRKDSTHRISWFF